MGWSNHHPLGTIAARRSEETYEAIQMPMWWSTLLREYTVPTLRGTRWFRLGLGSRDASEQEHGVYRQWRYLVAVQERRAGRMQLVSARRREPLL